MPIKQTIFEGGRPIKVWTDHVEPEAREQLVNTARLPFIFRHVAVMPDVHLGKGATVGSVIATEGGICPAAVGVDIGCGMQAVKTLFLPDDVQENIGKIRKSIERSIPTGFNGNTRVDDRVANWFGFGCMPIVPGMSHKAALHQLGSLGGGNHFIEICLDQNKAVWVVIHSGSRGTGKRCADFFISGAKGLMKKMFIDLPDPELAYFAQDSDEFRRYFAAVDWCQQYAKANRDEMMARVLKDISYALFDAPSAINPIEGQPIDCHHNYIAKENHFGRNVLVTRKGAVRARAGDLGIIPGSMGTRSYIVCGLGNEDSFHSCSHGAGRRMSRTKARATFTNEDLRKQTEGVDCRKDDGVLDEIPGSYKDIDEVMANQTDLVEVVATLKQIMCVKG